MSLDELTSLVMLSCERPEILEQTLRALYDNTNYGNFELCIYDNGSVDPQVREVLQRFQEERRGKRNGTLKVHYNPKNLGCAGGRKRALEDMISPEAKYFVTVDNDMLFSDGWLTNLVMSAEEDPTIGAVAPLVRHPTDARLGIDSGRIQFNGGTLIDDGYFLTFLEDDANKYVTDSDLKPAREIDWVLGGGTLFRRSVNESITHNPDLYPNGFEDYDFSLRMSQNGWRLVSCPESVLTHIPTAFARKLGFDLPKENSKALTRYEQARGNVREKWTSLLNFIRAHGKNPVKSWNMEKFFGCYIGDGVWPDEKIKAYFDFYVSPEEFGKPLTTYVLQGHHSIESIYREIDKIYAGNNGPLEIIVDGTFTHDKREKHRLWLLESEKVKETGYGITGIIRALYSDSPEIGKGDRHSVMNALLLRRSLWSDKTSFVNGPDAFSRLSIYSPALSKVGNTVQNPLVSVYVTLSAGNISYLSDCLDSILQQSFAQMTEVSICFDGTHEEAKELFALLRITYGDYNYQDANSRIKATIHGENKGAAAASNTAIAHSKGKYVLQLDPDDRLSDEYAIEKLVTVLEREPSIGLLYADYTLIDQGGNKIGTCPNEGIFSSHLLRSGYNQAQLRMWRKETLEGIKTVDGAVDAAPDSHGCIFDESLRVSYDYPVLVKADYWLHRRGQRIAHYEGKGKHTNNINGIVGLLGRMLGFGNSVGNTYLAEYRRHPTADGILFQSEQRETVMEQVVRSQGCQL